MDEMVSKASRGLLCLALLSCLAWLGTGCARSSGDLVVEPQNMPNAASFRVNVYALEPGESVIDEVVGTPTIKVADVPTGRWAVLVQALDSRGDTFAYHQAQVVIDNGTTILIAGPFIPGLPPTPPGPAPSTETFTLSSFGGNQAATLVDVQAPAGTTGQPVSVSLTTDVAESSERAGFRNRADAAEIQPGCGRCPAPELLAEENLEIQQLLSQPRPEDLLVNRITFKFQEIPIGGTFDFFIVLSSKNVTCRKMADGDNSIVFAEVVSGNPVIDTATAEAVVSAFDQSNPFRAGSGIYDRTREVFGSEWNSNPTGGRDGDPEVVLVVLSSSSIGGSNVFGFFRPGDEMTRAAVATSNEGEILYLNAAGFGGDMYDGLATLAHEFQHMVDYNEKVIRDGTFTGVAEETTLDEGFSVLSEELNGFTLTSSGGGNSFMFGAIREYLANPEGQSFFQFNLGLESYGAGFLFVRYLHDRLGEDGIRDLVTSPEQGMTNIQDITGRTFSEWFMDWVVANLATDLGGPVPAELRYINLPLDGTYTIRNQGTASLNGVTPAEVQDPVGDATTTFDLPPWSARYARFGGGNGEDLGLTIEGVDTVRNRLLLEDPEGEFSSLQD
ncbi:MAG: hypothetical protein HY319_23760 [Armatimonadetes bacterium]|nr:hypothetical protein [Armatimonadota bacterium]